MIHLPDGNDNPHRHSLTSGGNWGQHWGLLPLSAPAKDPKDLNIACITLRCMLGKLESGL